MASHTPITDFLEMPITRFNEFYSAIRAVIERTNEHKKKK